MLVGICSFRPLRMNFAHKLSKGLQYICGMDTSQAPFMKKTMVSQTIAHIFYGARHGHNDAVIR